MMIGIFRFSLRIRLSSNYEAVGCSSLKGMKGAVAAWARPTKQTKAIRQKGFNILKLYVLFKIYNIGQMAKKQKKLFVWQKQQPKIRKKRQTKPKQKVQIVEEYQQSRNQVQNHIKVPGQQGQMNDAISQANQMQIYNIIDQNFEKNQLQEKLRKELEQKDKKDQLIQRLKTIKQIFHCEVSSQNEENILNLNKYRGFECNEIQTFLIKKQDDTTENSNVLYIYGTPGTGKTFTIRSMLQNLNLLERTKWINCLVMLNKSLLRYTEPLLDLDKRNDIIVIDEFDQMEKQFKNIKFLRSFKIYLKEILNKSCVANINQIKFVFISNKSFESVSQQFVQAIKDMIKAESITEIPFLPYTSSNILSILKNKVKKIQDTLGGQPIFSDSFLQLTSKREYSRFQDIRKVINFIYSQYQNAELMKLSSQTAQFQTKERSAEIEMILSMPRRQKLILKRILVGYQKFLDNNTPVLVQWLYKQGSKNEIERNTIDVWLKQWCECGMISLKSYSRQGHHLYRTNAVVSLLSLADYQLYFY